MKTTVHYLQVAPIYLLLFALCLAGAVQAQKAPVPPPDAASFNNRLAAAPLLFTENKGQVADREGVARPDILFTAHSAGAKIYLTATGIHYQFERTILPEGYESDERKVKDRVKQEALRKEIETQTSRFTLSLKGANPAPHIRKEAPNEYTENFYLAHCAITGVHTYDRIVYENVYPGIDWVIYSKVKGMEYDFIVHPGADPDLIKLDVKDTKKVRIATDGGLLVTTELGEVKENAPVSYSGGQKVPTSFKKFPDGTIGFSVEAYHGKKELRIDPTVTWATYYGGVENESGYCSVDSIGNVYLSGYTASTSGIASGGFQNNYAGGANDGILVKFNTNGNRLWATYYGGSNQDIFGHNVIDGNGNIYVAGWTKSSTGIASGGFQNFMAGITDAILVKFNSSGARLWGTNYGGSSSESAYTCALDPSGNIYLCGSTTSTGNIASNGWQNYLSNNSNDAFLAKFSSNGNRLWATYYGGDKGEEGWDCITDDSGNVYMVGVSLSAFNIASEDGFKKTLDGISDAFIVKFNSGGNRLWGTYYGGSSSEQGTGCAVDNKNNVYLTGVSTSVNGIASGGFQDTLGGMNDAYLVKFSSSGSRLWATYYGGTDVDFGIWCAVDSGDNVYMTGQSASLTNIASNGFQNTNGGGFADAFLVKFDSTGNRKWGSYYGGNSGVNGYEESLSVAVDGNANVYMSGFATSSGLASGGFQNTFGGGYDAFLVKITDSNVSGFTSIANGNWNNPAIWSGGIVPSAGSVVIINTVVTVTANTSCYSIRVNPSGSVTVSPGVNLTVLH